MLLADTLTGTTSADRLIGSAGNDYLSGLDDNDSLDGGGDNDTLLGGIGNDTISGGNGNDSITDYQGANQIDGGASNDTIDYIGYGDTGSTITGGAGQDTFRLTNASYAISGTVHVDGITDFTTGVGGDVLDLAGVPGCPLAIPVAPNPFVAGCYRFLQNGTDTLFQVDKDGPSGAAGWVTVVKLQNTTATAFTRDDIAQNWNPQGPTGISSTDRDLGHALNGTPDNDTLAGNGGNDTLDGGYSADSLLGGADNDQLGDVFGANTLDGGDGNDTCSSVSSGDTGSTLTGGAGQDFFIFSDVGYRVAYNPTTSRPEPAATFCPRRVGAAGRCGLCH